MIDDVPRTARSDADLSHPAEVGPGDVCGTAITEIVRLILELTSTNAAIDYESGARVRRELENGLSEAAQTFESLPEGPARAEALRRLDGLRIVAERQLAIAPAPSTAAIAAADAGDPSAWRREAERWTADRLGHGASRPRPARRPRSDTRPETPGALGTGRASDPAMPRPVTPAAPEDPSSDEEHP